jgi:acetolactate synthase-1/2/3 large subunit
VLGIGTELGPTDYDMYEDGFFSVPGAFIRIDVDPAQLMRTRPPEIGIIGDAGRCAAGLLGLVSLASGDGVARAAQVRALVQRDVPPAMLGDLTILETIRDTLPGVLIAGDSTQLVYAGNTAYEAASPRSYFNSATGFGTLGYGLPAGIGAKVGRPERPVVVLAGDGGVQFSLAELASAMEASAPVILMLHDNGGYGEIKSYMVAKNVPPLGVDLYTPDFIAIGHAYGWHAERLERFGGLKKALQAAQQRDVPTVLVFGDEVRKQAAAQMR